MNAQQAWKSHYTKFRLLRSARDKRVEKTNMHRFTREAALERKLEAAQRRIEELEQDIDAFEQERNDLEAHIALTEFAKAEFSA